MKITFNQEEINSAFACKLLDIGISNIDPSTVNVSVKSVRDGKGGHEAEVDFSQVGSQVNSTVAADGANNTADTKDTNAANDQVGDKSDDAKTDVAGDSTDTGSDGEDGDDSFSFLGENS